MKTESFKSIFIKAIMSGVMISIGSTVYLNISNKLLGGFLFSFGLFTIIQFGFSLYTGKVGYIPERKPIYIREVLITFLGNAVSTCACAYLIRATRIGGNIHETAVNIMNAKINDTVISQLILGYFCGMLMYLAVENAKNSREKKNDFSMVFGTAMPVMIFIFSGFNHSVADCFYMFAADPSAKGFSYIGIVAVGNALGGMTIPIVKKVYDKV